jgi:hypothetical protein
LESLLFAVKVFEFSRILRRRAESESLLGALDWREKERESEESRRRAERERFHRRAAASESDVSGRRERCIAFRLQTCSLSRLSPFQPKCACAVTGRKEQSAARREQFERVQWRGTRGEGKGEKTNRRAARGKSERAISLLLSLARASGDSIAGHALGSRRERDKPNSRRRTLERAMATNVGGKEREKEWFRSFDDCDFFLPPSLLAPLSFSLDTLVELRLL